MKEPAKDGESPIHILWLPTIFMAGVAYVVSIIDVIPISFLDDLVVIIAMVWFFTSWLPKNRHRIYWFSPKTQARPQADQEGAAGPAEGAQKGEFDPFEVLNVSPGASPEEVKTAYREMLSKYHPDKVSHLGDEFQKIAHDKALDIQKAYETLGGKG